MLLMLSTIATWMNQQANAHPKLTNKNRAEIRKLDTATSYRDKVLCEMIRKPS